MNESSADVVVPVGMIVRVQGPRRTGRRMSGSVGVGCHSRSRDQMWCNIRGELRRLSDRSEDERSGSTTNKSRDK